MANRKHQKLDSYRRGDLRAQLERDKERLSRRQPSPFWKSVALIGSVGWPIALSAIGGILLGRYLDRIWGTGVRMSLALVTAATIFGTVIAYRSVTGGES